MERDDLCTQLEAEKVRLPAEFIIISITATTSTAVIIIVIIIGNK